MSDADAKTAVQIRLTDEELKALDELRVKEPGIPTRGVMAKLLVTGKATATPWGMMTPVDAKKKRSGK